METLKFGFGGTLAMTTTARVVGFGLAMSVVCMAQSPPTQQRPAANPDTGRPGATMARAPQTQTEQAQIEAARLAMSAATITIKGHAFPKRLSSPGAKMQAQSFCEPYDTRKQPKVAELTAELPKGTKKDHSETFSSTYSPPLPIWVISSYQRTEENRIGPVSVTVDAVPGGYKVLSSSQFQSEYNSMKNYVLGLNILEKVKVDIALKLDEYVKNYSSYSMEISASHGTAMHKAVLSGAGKFNGRTAYHGWIDTVEVCAPPEATDQAALRQTLKSWVDGLVKGMPTALPKGGPEKLNPGSLIK
ncbi:hypothetical protein [Paludibaculum fermentans]|uniref:hypothetical protein n=1 Tax=Paludibaculum fermentans TaxID=1473598 RepID=UPI003EBDE308